MANTLFLIEPDALQQAKDYAVAACRETGLFSQRFDQALSELYEAVRGIDEARAEGWSTGVYNTENNLNKTKKSLKEQTEKALTISLMIQAAIDQGEETSNVLTNEMGQLQFTMQGLANIANNFNPQVNAQESGQVLGATKSVALTGAALTGAFALTQPEFLANLQSALGKFTKHLFHMTVTGVEGMLDALDRTPDLSNPDATVSLTYGAGTLWMVDAYRKGSRYDKSIWPEGYKSDAGCGVAATATALSGLGIQELPKDIYKTNGNSVNMDWSGVATANGVQVTQERKLAEKALTYEERVAMIDAALEKYVENPEKYAPPIIGFTEGYNGGDNHYVVVYGKNADGSYKIVDSSGNNIQTYTLEEEDYWQDNEGKTFHANLNQIVQYYR